VVWLLLPPLQESVSSAKLAVLEGKQHEEERVRAKLAALSSRLQELNKEAVALVWDYSIAVDLLSYLDMYLYRQD